MMLISNNNINTRNNLGNKLGSRPANTGNTQFSKKQFGIRAYDIYNQIPSIITSIEDKKTFKKYLKRYFFNPTDLPDPKVFKISGLVHGL